MNAIALFTLAVFCIAFLLSTALGALIADWRRHAAVRARIRSITATPPAAPPLSLTPRASA